MKKRSFTLAMVMILASASAQPDANQQITLSPEAYLEYVKAENGAVRAQITELQKTIQEERKAHYEFVEGVYRWTAVGAGALMGVIIFLGWQTRQQVRKDLYDFMKDTVREPIILNKLLAMVNSELNLEKGEFHFIAEANLHHSLQKEEISLLSQRGISAKLKKIEDSTIQGADVLIYRFNPEDSEKGEDQKLTTLLAERNNAIPIVVYAPDGLRIKGETQAALGKYKLYHIANNPVSLIDNVASAFRVSKLKSK